MKETRNKMKNEYTMIAFIILALIAITLAILQQTGFNIIIVEHDTKSLIMFFMGSTFFIIAKLYEIQLTLEKKK